MTPQTNPHRNAEKVVKCPVDGCEAEKLSRGMHLHILRSSGNGHGPQGTVPEHLDIENLKEVGTREVEVNYPEERKSESVARLCPYCEVPFKGKNGVLIHLGQVAGRKNHPPDAPQVHDPEDFPVVKLDDDENIISVVNRSRMTAPRSDTNEEETEEADAFAEFSKKELDYLYEVFHSANIDDSRVERILQRPYL